MELLPRPTPRFLSLGFVVTLLVFLAARASAATVTVNDAGDTTNACATTGSGTCTLRDALTFANANSGTTIAFGIAGGGVHTITPGSPYATITAPVTIDGFTQPGSSPNTNGPGLGDNSVHLIEINGTNSGGGNFAAAFDFRPGSDGSVVRGLVINHCPSAAVQLLGPSGLTIEGNFLGTDPTGASAAGDGAFGILVDGGSTNATIGGTAPAARNVISGNPITAIGFGNDGADGGSGHMVQGNFIGTDASGTAAVGNGTGISLAFGVNTTTIGGTTPAARNLISGNTARGIGISNGLGSPDVTNNLVEGNFIGTDVTGTLPLGNQFFGIGLYGLANTIGGSAAGAGNVIADNANGGIDLIGASNSVIEGNFVGTDATGTIALGNHGIAIGIGGASPVTVGGVGAGEGNVIAFNSAPISGGVVVYSGTGVVIRGNSIHDNLNTGIDLGNDGVTPNDLGDGDVGANNLQNFPVLVSVTYGGAHTTVSGLLNSTPGTTFQLDFYANPPCSNFPREFLQGETYLGSSEVMTDGSGNAPFSVSTLPPVASGSRIAVTATDPSGNTSEFSQRLPFSVDVHSGPPAGGTALNISGTNFLSGATVTIGGVPAAGVVVNSYVSLSATTPVFAPGTANDLVVTNTDNTTGTLVKAFVADFLDVPNTQQFYFYVTTLVSNAITAGVGGGLYGVNNDTLRQQMAVFILKGKHGLCYTPPTCTGVFTDVPCPSPFANWIEAMAAEGITGGCGGGNFCPQNPVRRDQMSVFLLRAEHGAAYVPPACTGIFADVPCPSPFADWIEQLSHENITGGCGGGNYCPSNPNTRGQMAVFIVKTFNLM
ncbi:MAG TPA: S-layer homology domain-containing protein [Thermoanaerobaculia bacterium]|nr:S-layer homology domain-containing protein [Thermoanaerobaculia bacterium]